MKNIHVWSDTNFFRKDVNIIWTTACLLFCVSLYSLNKIFLAFRISKSPIDLLYLIAFCWLSLHFHSVFFQSDLYFFLGFLLLLFQALLQFIIEFLLLSCNNSSLQITSGIDMFLSKQQFSFYSSKTCFSSTYTKMSNSFASLFLSLFIKTELYLAVCYSWSWVHCLTLLFTANRHL